MNMTNKKLNILLPLIVLIILTTCAFVLFYDFPQEIDVQYPAMEYREGDKSSAQATTVKIKGRLSRPLFHDPIFKGEFIIDKYNFTKTYELMDIVFYKHIRNGWGSLTYTTVNNGQPIIQSFGSIWISRNFDELKILVYEPIETENKSSTDLRLMAPAKTYDEARLIEQTFD